MTLPQIIDSIISQVQSDVTAGTKFNSAYLQDVIHNAKNTVQNALYTKYGKINSAWTMQFEVEYSKDLQESTKFRRFLLPTPAVTLGFDNSGIVYAGTKDGCQNYATVQSRGELNTFLSHRVTKKDPIILYSDTYLEVYSHPLLQELLIDYVPSNPTLLPTYNMDQSEYPLCEEGLLMLKDLVYQKVSGVQAKAPTNYSTSLTDKPTAIPTE